MADEKPRSAIGTFAFIGGALGVVLGLITGEWAVWVPAGGILGVATGFAMDYFRRA